MRIPFAAALALVLAAGPAGAERLDPVAALAAGEGSAFPEVKVQPLEGAKFVAAWSAIRYGAANVPAQARVFASDGTPVTDPLPCTEDPGDSFPRSPSIAVTPDGDVVFGCDLQRRSGLPIGTHRAFSADLEPIGARTTYIADLFSNVYGLASVEDGVFVATVVECLPNTSCRLRHERRSTTGERLGVLPPRRTAGWLVPHGNRFLAIALRGDWSQDWLFVQKRLVSATGDRLAKVQRIFRAPGGQWPYTGDVHVARGEAGRTAVLVSTPPVDNAFRLSDKARVAIVDGDDAATTRKLDPLVPGFHYADRAANAWALPLASGFYVLWSREPWWGDLVPPLHGVWLQRFSEEGAAIGASIPLLPGAAVLAQPEFDPDDGTWLVPIHRKTDSDFRLEIRRLSSGPACGDANGDGGVSEADAQHLAASLAGHAPVCDPCVCDVDRSGSVDADDASALGQAARTRTPLECARCGGP